MFASLKKLVGNITVDVYDKVVTVEGVPTHVITGDIRRVWGTSKIEANLFLKIEDSSFSFHEFFCLEVHYAISRLIEERKTRANRRTLAKILTALETYTWLANTKLKFPPKLDHSVVKDFVYPPLPHQEGFFEAYDQVTQQFDLHGSMLAGAAGSGKTYAGLVWSEMLHADHVIILAPKNALHLVWEKNIREVFKTPQSYWMSDSDKPYAGQKFIIANYEFLVTLLEMARHISRKKLAIVLDESHNLNEVRSLRTERFLELCEMTNCQNVLWLSGTPIKALAVEAIPFIRCIDPLFTPDVEAAFRKIFGVSSVRAMDMLNHRLTGLLYTIEKKELGLDDPVFEEIKVKVPHGERFTLEAIAHEMRKFTEERYAYYAERKPRDEKIFYDALDYFTRHAERSQKTQLPYYYRCLDTVIRSGGDARLCAEEMMFCNRFEKREVVPLLPKEMKEPFRDSKSVVKYVKLKIQGECLGRVVGRARIDAHVAMARYLDYVAVVESSEKKTVVFTSYVEVIEDLMEYLPTLELSPLFVYAKTNAQLTETLNVFGKDPETNPLVATYASLSTAVPITVADVMVLLDAPWRDYKLQQTVARINRLGATTRAHIYTAVLDTGTKPNISTRSFDVLKWSQQQVAAITGVVSPYELKDDLAEADLALEEFGLQHEDATPAKPSYMSWE